MKSFLCAVGLLALVSSSRADTPPSLSITLTPGQYLGFSCVNLLPGCPAGAITCVTPDQGKNPLLLIPDPGPGCTRTLNVSGNGASWSDACPGGPQFQSSGSLQVTSSPVMGYSLSTSSGTFGAGSDLEVTFSSAGACSSSSPSARAAFERPMQATVMAVDPATGAATLKNVNGQTMTMNVVHDSIKTGATVNVRRKKTAQGDGPACLVTGVIPCDAKDCGVTQWYGFDRVTIICPGEEKPFSMCEPQAACRSPKKK